MLATDRIRHLVATEKKNGVSFKIFIFFARHASRAIQWIEHAGVWASQFGQAGPGLGRAERTGQLLGPRTQETQDLPETDNNGQHGGAARAPATEAAVYMSYKLYTASVAGWLAPAADLRALQAGRLAGGPRRLTYEVAD